MFPASGALNLYPNWNIIQKQRHVGLITISRTTERKVGAAGRGWDGDRDAAVPAGSHCWVLEQQQPLEK